MGIWKWKLKIDWSKEEKQEKAGYNTLKLILEIQCAIFRKGSLNES